MSAPADSRPAASSIAAAWVGLGARERRLVLLAAVVVGAALLWWIALAPALRTLRQAESERATLDAQLQQMQQLKAQAEALRALPRLSGDEALKALQASVRQRLGRAGQLAVLGSRATLTLTDAPAFDLAAWLQDARVNARTVPTEARLTRGSAPGQPRWSGTLTLALPDAN
ncbi:MAG: type II secretion system protein M [Burkholderiaceae bacterium]|jgi:general secretion pathway protein M|nr:type II secretion system protein M [Burkholderiaceae bacterium]